MSFQNKPGKDVDVRMNATTRIWGFATIMLGFCVPALVRAVDIGYVVTAAVSLVPLSVIGAAAFGTAAVWRSGAQEQLFSTTPTDLKQLEERMANLEIIHRYENALQAEKDINSQLRAEQKPEPTSYEQEPRKLSIL